MDGKFFAKLFQIPNGAKFVFNGVVFTRGKYLPSYDAYRCDSENFNIILHRNTNVELMSE